MRADYVERTTLGKLKKGDYFMLKENGKVYVREEYDRSSKKYGYVDFDDMCNWHEGKSDKVVLIGFTF